jgi:hypothetical protein
MLKNSVELSCPRSVAATLQLPSISEDPFLLSCFRENIFYDPGTFRFWAN